MVLLQNCGPPQQLQYLIASLSFLTGYIFFLSKENTKAELSLYALLFICLNPTFVYPPNLVLLSDLINKMTFSIPLHLS